MKAPPRPTRPQAWLVAVILAVAVTGCGGASSSGSSSAGSAAGGGASPGHSASTPAGPRHVPALTPPVSASDTSVRVPVLTYHRVAPASAVGQLDLKVDPDNFTAELEGLRQAGYHTVTQAQLFDALYHHGSLPSRPIVISVDDGYIDDVRTILPTLRRLHMVATFFVITGRMSEAGFLNAGQIRELDRAGMDVGDHTAHHVDLRLLSPGQLRAETAGSRRVLQQVLGHPVYFFAYPFGAYNDNVVAAVRAAGFTMAYSTAGGIQQSTGRPLTEPRVHVGHSETPSGLLSLLGGA